MRYYFLRYYLKCRIQISANEIKYFLNNYLRNKLFKNKVNILILMISPAITVNRDYENILGFKVGIGLWKTLRHWASQISRKSNMSNCAVSRQQIQYFDN